MRRRLVIALCWWFSSCSAETSGPQESTSATPRFVAFRQRAIFINRLDTPIQPPYASGSTPSADLLRSSDPAIVELDGYGNLIAHKEGQAVIRGSGSAVLEVTVRAPTRLELVPRRIELGLGQKGNVEVRSEGKTLPPESLRWQTTDPNIAAAFGSIVQAGMSAGTVT